MSQIPHGEIKMPPLSSADACKIAEAALGVLAPEMLERPQPLDLIDIIDHRLQRFGVHVVPATADELASEYGATDPTGDPGDPINILLREDEWESVFQRGRRAHHSRGTAAHEIGHAIVHVEKIRRRMRLQLHHLLARVDVTSIKAYESPEWQAWAVGGCLLMPPSMVRLLSDRSPGAVADLFEVSEAIATHHLRRMARIIEGR
ncbi:MAG: ImmA/IrrE family metallo-endopeptidase [Thermoanaerobaculia bacterium]|jgi:hypothetical protein